MRRTLAAPPSQMLNGKSYTFRSWSDRGAAAHEITVSSTSKIYTASYQLVGSARLSNEYGPQYSGQSDFCSDDRWAYFEVGKGLRIHVLNIDGTDDIVRVLESTIPGSPEGGHGQSLRPRPERPVVRSRRAGRRSRRGRAGCTSGRRARGRAPRCRRWRPGRPPGRATPSGAATIERSRTWRAPEAGEAVDGHHGRAARGQHGVEQEDLGAGEVLRHLLVVPAGDRRLLVALEAEVAHLGLRHELEERVEHAEAGAQHRHRDHPRRQPLDRRRSSGVSTVRLAERQVAGGLRDQGRLTR